MIRPPPRSTLFPYTPLSRSGGPKGADCKGPDLGRQRAIHGASRQDGDRAVGAALERHRQTQRQPQRTGIVILETDRERLVPLVRKLDLPLNGLPAPPSLPVSQVGPARPAPRDPRRRARAR